MHVVHRLSKALLFMWVGSFILEERTVIIEDPNVCFECSTVQSRMIDDVLQLVPTWIWMFPGFPGVGNRTNDCLLGPIGPILHFFVRHQRTLTLPTAREGLGFCFLPSRQRPFGENQIRKVPQRRFLQGCIGASRLMSDMNGNIFCHECVAYR